MFLDPLVFRKTAFWACGADAGYISGNVQLANAVGTGVADDKAIYAYMPRLIRYYLQQDPILSNVDTHLCAESDGLAFTLANMENLVVKPVGESGGYGVMIGPRAAQAEIEETRAKILANRVISSASPLSVFRSVRPYAPMESSRAMWICGLCHYRARYMGVAGRAYPGCAAQNSLVVNSSQGGGSKDTWVMFPEAAE